MSRADYAGCSNLDSARSATASPFPSIGISPVNLLSASSLLASGAHTSTVDQSPLQSFSSRYAAVNTYYHNRPMEITQAMQEYLFESVDTVWMVRVAEYRGEEAAWRRSLASRRMSGRSIRTLL